MALTDSIAEMFSTLQQLTAQTVANYHTELTQIEADQARLAARSEAIHEALAEIGEGETVPAAKATKAVSVKPATTKKRGQPAAAKAKTASSPAAGIKAIAYLKKHAGEFIASEVLAKEIGTSRVGDAIKGTGEPYEKRGPGRKKEYRVKP